MRNRQVGSLISVRFNIGIAALLFILGIGLSWLYIAKPAIRTELTFVTAIIGGFAVVYSGYYMGLALRENIRRDKLKQSFDFTDKLNSIDRASIRVFIEKTLSSGEIAPADFHERIISDPKIHPAVKSLLGLFEDISIAVQYDYVDEEVIYLSLAFLAPYIFQTFSPFIEEERRRFNDSRLFCEFEKLAGSWKLAKSLVSGKDLLN